MKLRHLLLIAILFHECVCLGQQVRDWHNAIPRKQDTMTIQGSNTEVIVTYWEYEEADGFDRKALEVSVGKGQSSPVKLPRRGDAKNFGIDSIYCDDDFFVIITSSGGGNFLYQNTFYFEDKGNELFLYQVATETIATISFKEIPLRKFRIEDWL